MKTRLTPLLTAFDALDLALRIAGVIGGIAAIATHLPGTRRGEASQVPAMAMTAMHAPRPGHHASAAGGVRVHLSKPPAVPVPPMWVMTTAVE